MGVTASGYRARWAALSADPARRRELAAGRDRAAAAADAARMAAAFAAAQESGARLERDAELMSAGWARAERAEAGERAMAGIAAAEQAMTARMHRRPQGFWPDGTPVGEGFKRAVMSKWQAERDAYYGRRAPRRDPVLNTVVEPGGVSPLVAHIFGLD